MSSRPAEPQSRLAKMSLYKEETTSPEGREITFTGSIDFITEAMDPGNDMFDETGVILVVWRSQAAGVKKSE